MNLIDLSDEALLSSLDAICGDGRRLLARLVVHLAAVEERSLHLKAACPSLFEFCIRRLGMSEGEAFRRIAAARLVKRFPSLLARIETGALHLTAIVLLRDHFTESNVDELADAATGKTKREIEELIAQRAPRPDVASMIRKLPAPVRGAAPAAPLLDLAAPQPKPAQQPKPVPQPARPRVEPLSEDRYKVQFTASGALREKLERARDLMRHREPSGDVAVVVERALDALLAKLERERLGKTARPQRTQREAKPSYVRQAARREVFERDGEQCTFVDGAGQRCSARAFLELDHVESRVLGGSSGADNLRILCRSHNRFHAEQVFGKDHVARRIHLRQEKRHRAGPSTAAPSETIDVATRGLVSMGFREGDARRAVDRIWSGDGGERALPLEEVLRRALGMLT